MDENCRQCYNYFSKARKGVVYDSILYTCPIVFNNFNTCRICVNQLNKKRTFLAPPEGIWAKLTGEPNGIPPYFSLHQTNDNKYKVYADYSP